jgi:eukaryotic-like serine/threonine-protein kinase
MIKKSNWWLLPFLFFIGGYVATRSVLHNPSIEAPSVIGLSLNQAFITLSNNNLNARLLELKEDGDLPEGTVINQIPSSRQLIKPRQTVFLTLSKQPPKIIAPDYVGKPESILDQKSYAHGLKLKKQYVISDEPAGICIGQNPTPGSPLDFKIMTVYVSSPSKQAVVWPNFIGKRIDDVLEFLSPYQLEIHIERTNSRGTIITDQRPLPGSIVDLSQKPFIQLHV